MEIKDIKTFENLQTALQNKKVSGYIWMVSHKKPCIYQNKEIDFDKLEYGNPVFNKIQEAYLYDGTNSIHVKNIDGTEYFFIHKIDDFINKKKEYKVKDLEYPSHIITGKNLKFKQVYKLTESISGSDFKTWQPIVRLFVGFSNQKNN